MNSSAPDNMAMVGVPRHDHHRPHHRAEKGRWAGLVDRAARPPQIAALAAAADTGPLQMSLVSVRSDTMALWQPGPR